MSILEQLHTANRGLVRTVDSMSDDAWPQPSLLPDWTRAHVVAHLALNAEAFTGVLTGVAAGSRVPMYASQEARESDITDLAGATPRTLRDRLLGSVTDLDDDLAALPDDLRGVVVERVPGSGRTFLAGGVDDLRLREVEIHHVDLGLGHTVADWPPSFSRLLVEDLAESRRSVASCVIHAVDLDASWTLGDLGVGPTVSGSAAALGWWLSGRGDGQGLTSDSGVLPQIPEW